MFPFVKFPGVDTILGPEMKSTGEVMGVGTSFGEAFVKSQLAAGVRLPESGTVFISVKNQDKPRAVEVARGLHALGSVSYTHLRQRVRRQAAGGVARVHAGLLDVFHDAADEDGFAVGQAVHVEMCIRDRSIPPRPPSCRPTSR